MSGRDIAKTLVVLDWVTPLEILVRRVVSGPSRTFLIHEDCGRGGYDIVNLLRRQGGIRPWGYMFAHDHYMFQVREDAARFALYLLTRAGIPVASPTPEQLGRPQMSFVKGLGRWLR